MAFMCFLVTTFVALVLSYISQSLNIQMHFYLVYWLASFFFIHLCLQINGKQNTTFELSVKLISNKMHEAPLKLDLTQRQYNPLIRQIEHIQMNVNTTSRSKKA